MFAAFLASMLVAASAQAVFQPMVPQGNPTPTITNGTLTGDNTLSATSWPAPYGNPDPFHPTIPLANLSVAGAWNVTATSNGPLTTGYDLIAQYPTYLPAGSYVGNGSLYVNIFTPGSSTTGSYEFSGFLDSFVPGEGYLRILPSEVGLTRSFPPPDWVDDGVVGDPSLFFAPVAPTTSPFYIPGGLYYLEQSFTVTLDNVTDGQVFNIDVPNTNGVDPAVVPESASIAIWSILGAIGLAAAWRRWKAA